MSKSMFIHQSEINVIRAALEHYQHADDGAYILLKGFAAKKGDHDPRSPARRALQVLDSIEAGELPA